MEAHEKQDIIENNLLLKLQSGSHLYGLDTPNSDVDYLGVVWEPFKYKVGFNTFKELDVSFKDKLENGRNSKEAIDEKYYSLTRFVELLITNNPTIIELLFSKNNLHQDKIIETLYKKRHLFLSKSKVHKAFIGYAISQEKKMETKSENLSRVHEFYELTKDLSTNGTVTLLQVMETNPIFSEYLKEYNDLQVELQEKIDSSGSKNEVKSLKNKFGKLMLGSREFSVFQLFKKVKKQLKQIQEQKSHRSELVEKHGYDTKFFSHTIRLMIEGEELLTTGKIEFPLKERDFLLDCKLGKYSYEEAMELVKKYKKLMENIPEEDIVLTDKTQVGKIEDIVLEFYKEKYILNS